MVMGRTNPRNKSRAGGGDCMKFVAWHLGLGDAIACAAIIAKLAKTGEDIFIPCWDHNKISVQSFFVEYPNVKVISESEKSKFKPEGECETIALGFYNKDLPQLPDEDFVQWFYRGAGMTMEEKEEHCPLKVAALRFQELTACSPYNYNLIHEDSERGYVINRPKNKLDFRPSKRGTILRHTFILNNVKEVHCIDSSFLHLAEALNVPGKKVYHKYARPESTDYKYLKGWEVLNDK